MEQQRSDIDAQPLLNKIKREVRFVAAAAGIVGAAVWSCMQTGKKPPPPPTKPVPSATRTAETDGCFDLDTVAANESLIGKTFRMTLPAKEKEKERTVRVRMMQSKERGLYLEINGREYATDDTVTFGIGIFAKKKRLCDLITDVRFDATKKQFIAQGDLNDAKIGMEEVTDMAHNMADRLPTVIVPNTSKKQFGVDAPAAIVFTLSDPQYEEIASIQH